MICGFGRVAPSAFLFGFACTSISLTASIQQGMALYSVLKGWSYLEILSWTIKVCECSERILLILPRTFRPRGQSKQHTTKAPQTRASRPNDMHITSNVCIQHLELSIPMTWYFRSLVGKSIEFARLFQLFH